MADENTEEEKGDSPGAVGGQAQVKCPECVPGLPGWMATFSDLVTLLLTFFVLLLSFAKTESAKYEAALGSIRNAFGGNVREQGEPSQSGKSPDDSPTMIESQKPPQPFPIDFLTTEGILDKYEINRASSEELEAMKSDLNEFNLQNSVEIYETPEGIRVHLKDRIYFAQGSVVPSQIVIQVYDRLVKMLAKKNWTVYVMGHASRGEESADGQQDAFALSASRAAAVARSLVKRGVSPQKITTSFYGDTRIPSSGQGQSDGASAGRYVRFMIRKVDITEGGHKVYPR